MEDLALQIDRSVACATIVRLMDDFHIRVGSDEYARKNDSLWPHDDAIGPRDDEGR